MKAKAFFSTALSLCFFSFLQAQKNFQPGLIVSLSGDTTKGWIDYRNWERNPKKILFKENMEAAARTYGVQELGYFEVTGKDAYLRSVIMKDMLPVNVNNAEVPGTKADVRDTAFLRALVTGQRLSLYELVDGKKHFYIREKDTLRELGYKIFLLPENNQMDVQNLFRNQLKGYLATAADEVLLRKIDGAGYAVKDLKQIVIALNGGEHMVTEAGSETQPMRRIQVLAGGGITRNNIQFSTFDNNLKELKANPRKGYNLMAGIDVYSKRRFQNMFLRLALSYTQASYYGSQVSPSFYGSTSEKKEYDLQLNSISPSVHLLYTVYRSGSLKLFAGVGGARYVTKYTRNSFKVTDASTGEVRRSNDYYLDYSRGWSDVSALLGVQFMDRLELNINPRLTGTFTDFLGTHASNAQTGLNLAFRF